MNLKLNLPYSKIYKRFSNEINNAVKKFSTAKDPITTSPSTWEYSLDWCVRITGAKSGKDFMAQLVSGHLQKEKSIDQELAEYATNCIVNLKIKAKSRRFDYQPLNYTPHEILNEYRVTLEEEEKEKQRVAKLSPIERQEEINDILKELRKDSGFMEFNIPIFK